MIERKIRIVRMQLDKECAAKFLKMNDEERMLLLREKGIARTV